MECLISLNKGLVDKKIEFFQVNTSLAAKSTLMYFNFTNNIPRYKFLLLSADFIDC